MFVGHIGAGLAVKRVVPECNLGALILAALFADLLLWMLVAVGVESVGPPESSGAARFFTFTFPYSHGLAASAAWSALAGIAGWLAAGAHAARRGRLAAALALAVFSHFLLDLLVHVPDLPLLGDESAKLGLGLWRNMPLALAAELGFVAAALAAYLRHAALSRGRTILVAAMVILAATLTAAGPYLPGEPPPPVAMALSSLATLMLLVAAGFFVEGRFGIAAQPGKE